jgi:predicted nucleotidyltransferase
VDRLKAQPTIDPNLILFAEQLRARIGAVRVLLFGSYARGTAYYDSDYDLIIIAPTFHGVDSMRRGIGLRQIWYEVGGNAPMDLICLTPEEFERASHSITLIQAVLPEAIDLLPLAVPA